MKLYNIIEDVYHPPYLGLICIKNNLKIFRVDGAYIRHHIDDDFTDFAHPGDTNYIPKDEIWIDREYGHDELNLFIDQAIDEYILMQHENPSAARREAGSLAKNRRRKFKHVDPHIQKLGTSSDCIIWLVNGDAVRAHDYNFVEGGHDLIYDYIPSNEVWIDNDVVPMERVYIIIHELIERNLMDIKQMNYEHAHVIANQYEKQCRNNPILMYKVLNTYQYGIGE